MKILLPIVAVLAGLALAPASGAGNPRAGDSRPPKPILRTGVVTGWRLSMEGTMYLRVRGADPRAEERADVPESWFRTPPVRSDLVDVEHLVLDAVTSLELEGDVVTVRAEGAPVQDGRSPETAYELVSLGRP